MEKTSFLEKNYLLFRLIMGINMLIHGGIRIFGDYAGFIERMEKMFSGGPLPEFLVTFGAQLISPLELIFGLLLLLGLKTSWAILILQINMMMLITGVCLLQKWGMAATQMGYVLYLFFLGNFIHLNSLSIDQMIVSKKREN